MRAAQRCSGLGCFLKRRAWQASPSWEAARRVDPRAQQGIGQARPADNTSVKADDVKNTSASGVARTALANEACRNRRACERKLKRNLLTKLPKILTRRELCHRKEFRAREKPPAITRRRLSGELLGLTCGCDRFCKGGVTVNRSGRQSEQCRLSIS